MRLRDKTAIITGSTSGLGHCCATLFAKEGAKVVVSGRDIQKGDSVVKEIRDAGGEAIFIKADVSLPEEVEGLVKGAVEHFGKLDIMVNNAGLGMLGRIEDTSVEMWDLIMNVNLRGVFLGCKYAIAEMLKAGRGSIVNISSVSGIEGGSSQIAYGASKGGVVLLTKSLAIDYAAMNIRVNCVCPGAMRTGMGPPPDFPGAEDMLKEWAACQPMGRISEDPTEVAYSVLFFASDECAFATGSVLAVDGGLTCGHKTDFFDNAAAMLKNLGG
jgi:NAD(P)-dependent dehydrogenase (short-subunit alcohol dehydrogenase family)